MSTPLPTTYRVSSHTDHVGPGSTYVVIRGQQHDGLAFVPLALERGATTIVVQADTRVPEDIIKRCKKAGVHISRVADALSALARLSAQAYDYPAKSLKIIGITGTDGKTTSVYLTTHILRAAGKRVAMLSGVQNFIDDVEYPSALTTAKADYLQMFLHECVERGIEYVVMEVSAQALTLHRVDQMWFDGVIFTNLAQEHAEWYGSLDDYFAAKAAILQHLRTPQVPVVAHADNTFGQRVAQLARNGITAGFAESADYRVAIVGGDLYAQDLTIEHAGTGYTTRTPLVGAYNAQNVVAVVGLANQLGLSLETIMTAIPSFTGAPGRLERYRLRTGAVAIVDYAHTPQAFEAVLTFVRPHARRVTIIFGASGGKDHVKRPLMGAVAARLADVVVITTDNPRTEDPHEIVRQIKSGVLAEYEHKVVFEPDRAVAIVQACQTAQPGDVILVVGKGTEACQIIGNERVPHSDRAVVQAL